MNSAEKKTNKKLAARIALRMSQGWSLEKIGHRTVWTMFGHLYSIRDGALIVSMAGGKQTFRPSGGDMPINDACADCGSTGHNTGSDTCPGPDVQDRLEDPNRQEVA